VFFRRVLFFPEVEKTAPSELLGVLCVPHEHRPTAPRAACLVQPTDVHDPLAVVLHGDQRGVQSIVGQFHDGATARDGVHADGTNTGIEPDHDDHAAVNAHNKRYNGHHADIAEVHETATAAAVHRFRARYRPAGSET